MFRPCVACDYLRHDSFSKKPTYKLNCAGIVYLQYLYVLPIYIKYMLALSCHTYQFNLLWLYNALTECTHQCYLLGMMPVVELLTVPYSTISIFSDVLKSLQLQSKFLTGFSLTFCFWRQWKNFKTYIWHKNSNLKD